MPRHSVILDRIRAKRKELGYSQEYMAERLGISPPAYSRKENGETKLDLDWLRDTTKELDMDLMELLASESVTVTVQEQKGGANGCIHVVNQNGIASEDVLRSIAERYEAHVKELQETNKRLLALLEKHLK
ncbi:MAG: helix-turn-helix transcriptional regulator [Flavobacteriales bacterium]